MDYLTTAPSPLGPLTLASDGRSLIGLWFKDARHFGATLGEETETRDNLPVFAQTRQWLALYFARRRPDFLPPLLVRGTDFRRAVCRLLLEIPYGETTTYGALAARLAKERGLAHLSAQAVGGAVARNPIALLLPCHRVIGKDGRLTGYAGGLWRKEKLLALEGVRVPR